MNDQTPVKRPKYGGKPAKLTPQTVLEVADRVSKGVPLTFALAMQNPPIPLGHWRKTLERYPHLGTMYARKVGEWIESALAKVNAATCRTLPGEVWTLERRLPEYFSTRSTPTTTVNVQVAVGVPNEVALRARAYATGQAGRPKPLRRVTPPLLTDIAEVPPKE